MDKPFFEPTKMKTIEFIRAVNEMLREKYNRYSNGSFGGANKRRKKREAYK